MPVALPGGSVSDDWVQRSAEPRLESWGGFERVVRGRVLGYLTHAARGKARRAERGERARKCPPSGALRINGVRGRFAPDSFLIQPREGKNHDRAEGGAIGHLPAQPNTDACTVPAGAG